MQKKPNKLNLNKQWSLKLLELNLIKIMKPVTMINSDLISLHIPKTLVMKCPKLKELSMETQPEFYLTVFLKLLSVKPVVISISV